MKKNIITVILFSSFLSACTSSGNMSDLKEANQKTYEVLAIKENEKLHENIKNIAEKALEAQIIRKQVANAQVLPNLTNDQIREAEWQQNYIPAGMDRELSIRWKAAPEPLLKTLAEYVDYEIDFEGKPYPIEKTITIYPVRQNVKKLIDEVDRQSDGYIKKIDIYEDLKFIKVIYQEH